MTKYITLEEIKETWNDASKRMPPCTGEFCSNTVTDIVHVLTKDNKLDTAFFAAGYGAPLSAKVHNDRGILYWKPFTQWKDENGEWRRDEYVLI